MSVIRFELLVEATDGENFVHVGDVVADALKEGLGDLRQAALAVVRTDPASIEEALPTLNTMKVKGPSGPVTRWLINFS